MAKSGAPQKFSEAHVNWVFWKIASHEPIGRKELVRETGLGEGSVRTILKRLDSYGLTKSARPGRSLTDNGRKVAWKLKGMVRVKQVKALEMTKSDKNVIVMVKGAGASVGSGMEQRDAAIACGKNGATTLVVEKTNLIMPGIDSKINMSEEYPKDAKKLMRLLNPEEGDVLVIGSEKTKTSSEDAAWIAASTLLS